MTIEVVYHSSQGEQKVTLTNVGDCTFDDDTKVLTITGNNKEDLADFRDWTYWRKVND